MRFIIYGLGAIGGSLAVRLSLIGKPVIGIARGAQLEAVRKDGLALHAADGVHRATFETVASPGEISFGPDDVILLTMKGQDTLGALHDLRDAGVVSQPIVCMQNGVANERTASRFFANVHGCVVMMPANYLEPGRVTAFGTPRYGMFDIGRYPAGTSETVVPLVDALNEAGFAAFAHDDVMRPKYGKLLLNLANGIDSALGADARDGKHATLARAEALAVYQAAGIEHDPVDDSDPRRAELLQVVDVPGATRMGSSAVQSLARGAGSIEVDYLNGEIAMLGRLHGVPTPVNAFFTHLARQLVLRGAQPGSLTEEEADRLLAEWQK